MRQFTGLLIILVMAVPAVAGPVTLDDFGPTAQIEDFTSLTASIPGEPVATPLVLAGRTYTTDAATFEVRSQFSGDENFLCTPIGSTARTITVDFATPAQMAGLSVTSSQTYFAEVEFFDTDGVRLDFDQISQPGGSPQFVGLLSDGNPIARIVVRVTSNSPTRITHVATDVPEPASLMLVGIGMAALASSRTRP